MSKSLVGKVENKKFAYFWLLIGGSVGNILIFVISDVGQFRLFILLPAIISILIAATTPNKKKRPKKWLGLDLIATFLLLVFLIILWNRDGINLGIFIPDALIILGCILGIMDW